MENLPHIGIRDMMAVTCWYLWWIRRIRIHEEVVLTVKNCATSITSLTANFIKFCSNVVGLAEAKWCRPLSSHVKLNVDAAFHEEI
jgi:hypothetical protein